MQISCKPHVSEIDRAKTQLEPSRNQAGQELLYLSCAILMDFTKRGFKELWQICLLCVNKPGPWLVAQELLGVPPGTADILQAVGAGLGWEAAGLMGTAVAAATSQLWPAPGWSFSDLV